MRRAATAAGIAALLAVAAVSGAAATGLPKLQTGWHGRYQVRPSSVYYTGDGTGVLGKLRRRDGLRGPGRGSLHWKSWSGSQATGTGTVWLKSCVPYCADSRFHSYRVRVTAGRVRGGHFTRMTLRYRFHGGPVVDRRCLSGRSWALCNPY